MKDLFEYEYFIDEKTGISVRILNTNAEPFNVKALDLGDIKAPSQPMDVLAVLFDLEGFTSFTKQVDPQLTVPKFIEEFLDWLFNTIRISMIQDSTGNVLWAEYPFYSKFMGDGVLFLWRIDLNKIVGVNKNLPSTDLQFHIQEFICNIIATMMDVCEEYAAYAKHLMTQHVDPPMRLRCGLARGTVIPIGMGTDFVGPCINIASRLQKFNGLGFAFSSRGIDVKGFNKTYSIKLIKKRASIRGIGENELIYLLKTDFEALPQELRSNLKDP